MSESNESAEAKHLSYEHYRLCFWIGFLTLGPLIMLSIGISSHPLGIIDHVIRFIVFFGLGGTTGGLATLFVGYPLELVCGNLSYGREQLRTF